MPTYSGKTAQSSRRASSIGEVVDALREWIHSGRLVAGQRLIEADLVSQLGTSRTHVRGAFQRLEGDGLISIEHNKGASVRAVSREELAHAMEVMQAVSLLLIEKAVEANLKPRVRTAIQRALDDTIAAETRQGAWSPRQLMTETAHFWNTLDRVQENPLVSETRQRMEATFFRLSLEDVDPPAAGVWLSYHRKILEAILAGDGAEAARCVRAYTRDVLATLLSLPDRAFTNEGNVDNII